VNTVEAILLGLTQGLTEFLPVSSSAHLAIVQKLLGMSDTKANLCFDVFLHVASSLAVMTVMAKEIASLFSRSRLRDVAFICLATVPAGLAGFFLRDVVELWFGSMALIGAALMVSGLWLMVGERRGTGEKTLGESGPLAALAVGIGQALAIVPGLSRSGTTMSAGMVAGMERSEAVRFSFLLSLPVILGAALVEGRNLVHGFQGAAFAPVAIGMVSAFVASLVALKTVFYLCRKRRLFVFSVYCILAGTVLLAVFR
jgi:undecaprenyl-diphosphatase